MQTHVQTVLGPASIEKLGKTLMHEHLVIGWPGWELDTRVQFTRMLEIDNAVKKLKELRELGVSTFVDPCPLELSRDPYFMAEVSRKSGMNIVCATGLYVDHGIITLGMPTYFQVMTLEHLQGFYMSELKDGIGPDHIKPGILKVSCGPDYISPHEEKSIRAGARSAVALDLRVTTHTTNGTMGPEQLDIFDSEGLPLHHALIGHCDWNPKTEYHLSLLKRGCYIGFDSFGVEATCSDEQRVVNLVELTKAGYAKQIMLSHDNMCRFLFVRGEEPPMIQASMARPKRRYTYIFQEIIPMMLAAGISQQTIDMMLTENPKRFFSGKPF